VQNFSHFPLDKLRGVWYNKNSARKDRARRSEKLKRVEISPHSLGLLRRTRAFEKATDETQQAHYTESLPECECECNVK
jgi:hypothetical protein